MPEGESHSDGFLRCSGGARGVWGCQADKERRTFGGRLAKMANAPGQEEKVGYRQEEMSSLI